MTTDTNDYAARILRKYGWEQGKGLGKEQQGIERPLSVPSQKTTEGIGYQASLFEPWWDNLYDKVASSITVKKRNKEERQGKCDSKAKASSSQSTKDGKKHRSGHPKRNREERSPLKRSTKNEKRSADKNKKK